MLVSRSSRSARRGTERWWSGFGQRCHDVAGRTDRVAVPPAVPCRLAAVALVIAVTAACDPVPMPDDADAADVSVEIGAGGDATVTVGLGGRRSEAELRDIGAGLKASVFGERPLEAEIEDNGGGWPLLVLRSTDVYERGRGPRVSVDTRPLCEGLVEAGVAEMMIWLSEPLVPHEWVVTPDADVDGVWRLASCDDAPRGVLAMSPQPWRFWLSLVPVTLLVAANVAVVSLYRRSRAARRVLTIGLGLLAAAAYVWVVFVGGAATGDHVEVAGQVSNVVNDVHMWMVLALAVGWPPATGTVTVLLFSRGLATHEAVPADRRGSLRLE